MCPVLAICNAIYSVGSNVEARTNGLAGFASCTPFSYVFYVGRGKRSKRMIFAQNMVVAALVRPISVVISFSSQEQMPWVAARRIVTFMQNTLTLRDWADCECIC